MDKIYLLGSLCGSLRVRVFVFLGGEKEEVRLNSEAARRVTVVTCVWIIPGHRD